MILLRLVYVLHEPLRGSKYDTYRSRACTRVCDRNGHNDGQRDLQTLVYAVSVQLQIVVPLSDERSVATIQKLCPDLSFPGQIAGRTDRRTLSLYITFFGAVSRRIRDVPL